MFAIDLEADAQPMRFVEGPDIDLAIGGRHLTKTTEHGATEYPEDRKPEFDLPIEGDVIAVSAKIGSAHGVISTQEGQRLNRDITLLGLRS